MTNYIFSFVAGALTTLSPCVFPILPFVVGSALREHRLGPVYLAGGLVVTFVVVGWSTAAFGSFLGIDQSLLRQISAVFLVFFGLAMMSKRLQSFLTTLVAPASRKAELLLQRNTLSGLSGQFLVGCLLGALWSPCSGPTLGVAIALASESGGKLQSGLMMSLFGLGAVSPLLFVSYGAQGLLKRLRPKALKAAERGKRVFAVIMLSIGLLILSGLDHAIEGWLVDWMPPQLLEFTTKF